MGNDILIGVSDTFGSLIADAVIAAQSINDGSITIDASTIDNTNPIIWNFSDQPISLATTFNIDDLGITDLAARSAFYQGETVSLNEVLGFDLINFVSSPLDDYLMLDGITQGHFGYDRFNGEHFGHDTLIGEANHLMVLLKRSGPAI